MNYSMADTMRIGQDAGAVSAVNRTSRAPGGRQATRPGVYASPLQGVAAGILDGVSPLQFMGDIDAANRALGNRAFLHWVGELQSVGRAPVTQGVAPPLQMMGKKKKKPGAAPVEAGAGVKVPAPDDGMQGHASAGKTGDAGAGKTVDAGAGPDEETVPELVAAQSQATGPAPEVEPGPGLMPSQAGPQEEAPVEKKKKKKSRVQVALNTLRGEGVEAFGDYIEAEIGEAALLRTLVERINRAEDLGGVRAEAQARVEARLQLLDPGGVAGVTGAVAPAPAPSLQPIEPAPLRSLSLCKQGAGGQVLHALSREHEPERAVCAQVKYVLNWREEALFDACVKGETGRFKRLLSKVNVDVNTANNYGTLLINATYGARVNIIKELLSRPDIDVNLATPNGLTPLYVAAHDGHVEVVKLLLDKSAINVNLATSNGSTPLFIAAQNGHTEVLKLLLAAPGIDLDGTRPDGASALLIAVQNNFPGVVGQLVRRGADVNLGLHEKGTPLFLAASLGYLEMVRILFQAPGIQVDQATPRGASPLAVAAQEGHKEIVRLLLRNCADPDIKSVNGFTALHYACKYGHVAIVQMLLHAGAENPDGEGQIPSPYDLAERRGHREVASILTAHQRRREAASSRPVRQ